MWQAHPDHTDAQRWSEFLEFCAGISCRVRIRLVWGSSSRVMSSSPMESERPLRAGLVAGSIAAVAAAGVSLPLHSPHDALLNTGSIVIGALAVGVATGTLWRVAPDRRGRLLRFAIIWAIGLGAIVAVAVGAEAQIDRSVSFVIPLAVIVVMVTASLTPPLAKVSILRAWWVTPAAVLVALSVGIGLAGQGDQESGRLELPPRSVNMSELQSGSA